MIMWVLTIKVISLVMVSVTTIDGSVINTTEEKGKVTFISGYKNKKLCEKDGNKKYLKWVGEGVSGSFEFDCTK